MEIDRIDKKSKNEKPAEYADYVYRYKQKYSKSNWDRGMRYL